MMESDRQNLVGANPVLSLLQESDKRIKYPTFIRGLERVVYYWQVLELSSHANDSCQFLG